MFLGFTLGAFPRDMGTFITTDWKVETLGLPVCLLAPLVTPTKSTASGFSFG